MEQLQTKPTIQLDVNNDGKSDLDSETEANNLRMKKDKLQFTLKTLNPIW